jgi:hypothetical protein
LNNALALFCCKFNEGEQRVGNGRNNVKPKPVAVVDESKLLYKVGLRLPILRTPRNRIWATSLPISVTWGDHDEWFL